MKTYNSILCVVDLSDENTAVAERAVEISRHFDSSLTLLHVVEPLPTVVTSNIVLPDNQDIERHLTDDATAILTKLKTTIQKPETTILVKTGAVKNSIIETANTRNSDLIVIGRHGRHGISRLLGSTANAVLNHAPCDVLAVMVNQ